MLPRLMGEVKCHGWLNSLLKQNYNYTPIKINFKKYKMFKNKWSKSNENKALSRLESYLVKNVI